MSKLKELENNNKTALQARIKDFILQLQLKEQSIRYYKGKHKVRKISKQSPQKTALYEFLEPNPWGPIGVKHVIPVRLCWRAEKR